jgi:phosphatidylserine/phosphatidylglycerophosphate/cardiolipin synthase-like enzyme
VKVYEYADGLLHTKSLTLAGEVTLIGSANMDRRSFELNYENNILFCDPGLTADVRQRQREYIARSRPKDLPGIYFAAEAGVTVGKGNAGQSLLREAKVLGIDGLCATGTGESGDRLQRRVFASAEMIGHVGFTFG